MSALYDRIGTSYTGSRRADPGLTDALARRLRLSREGRYLDLACGTGNYTSALSRFGGHWLGVDVSAVMLAQARRSSGSIDWVQASAEALPFADASLDAVVCTLGIHHFSGLDAPFSEVRRCLRSGPLVIFTGLAEQMRAYWLCHYFPRMMERAIESMPGESQIRAALSRVGFQSVTVTPFFVTPDLQDLFLYAGKHRPLLYLNPDIRANISSFAKWASANELADGLVRLQRDLAVGGFVRVQARFADTLGDYALITAEVGA
jgi:SAM-dependent methyltransferase